MCVVCRKLCMGEKKKDTNLGVLLLDGKEQCLLCWVDQKQYITQNAVTCALSNKKIKYYKLTIGVQCRGFHGIVQKSMPFTQLGIPTEEWHISIDNLLWFKQNIQLWPLLSQTFTIVFIKKIAMFTKTVYGLIWYCIYSHQVQSIFFVFLFLLSFFFFVFFFVALFYFHFYFFFLCG